MPKFTKRAQVLFTPEQYKVLIARASGQKRSVGEIIREAVEREILTDEQKRRRRKAVQELLSGKFALAGPPFDHVRWKREYEETKGRSGMAEWGAPG